MMTLDEMKKKKKELGYSNSRISELSGIPLGTVQKIFGGVTDAPRHETLIALEKALKESDNSVSDIMFLEEQNFEYGSAVKKATYTIDDYYALPDDIRAELINGELFDMAAPSGVHQIILGSLYAEFRNCIQHHHSDCHVLFAPLDVQLDRDIYTILQPDLIIFCGMENMLKNKYYGAPDFVAEILSPSSRVKDTFTKLNKYKYAHVREYWIIDPENKQVTVYHFSGDSDTETRKYSFNDKIPLGISDGKCIIDFSKIHKEAEPFYEAERY